MELSDLYKIRKHRINYQNSIDGAVDEVKVTDNKRQQVGGHFLSWLKNRHPQILAFNGDVGWFYRQENTFIIIF